MDYPHWYYFLALDDDLATASRYVEITNDNYTTYSIEFARLLLATCSEVDVLAKTFACKIGCSKKREDMTLDDCRRIIGNKFPAFHNLRIIDSRHKLEFAPWADWSKDSNPSWWREHNVVKHQRDTCFHLANLSNSLQALSGLFALLMYYYQEDFYAHRIDGWPQVLTLHPNHAVGMSLGHDFNLPDFGKSQP